MNTERVRVTEASRARPQIPLLRTISPQPVSKPDSDQEADYIVVEGEILYNCLVIFLPVLYLYLFN